MKKILLLNGSSLYSTGNLVSVLIENLKGEFDFFSLTADNPDKNYKFPANTLIREFQKVPSQLFGSDGFSYNCFKKKILRILNKINPDLIHIHNIHGYWMNLEIIVDYAESKNVPIVFTMHDCWLFTGRCAHFFDKGCYKWKIECEKCQFKKSYPKTRLFDLSNQFYKKKKKLLIGKNFVFVSPSNWVANFAKDSFLASEKILTINNPVNFDYISNLETVDIKLSKIDFSKKIILSVAYPFSYEKGLYDFDKLAKVINHSNYQIVLVGAKNEPIDSRIIQLGAIFDKKTLFSLYKKSYCFCFFSHAENYPTVLLESLACGVPIVSFDVGGCSEICIDGVTGYLIKSGDIDAAYRKIQNLSSINKAMCIDFARKKSIKNYTNSYLKIYKELIEK